MAIASTIFITSRITSTRIEFSPPLTKKVKLTLPHRVGESYPNLSKSNPSDHLFDSTVDARTQTTRI